jgi:uncharacterized protein (DUF58 family)
MKTGAHGRRRQRVLTRDRTARALQAAEQLSPVLRRMRTWYGVITPLGRAVFVVGVMAWIAGWWLGWQELLVFAGGCLVLLLLAMLFVVRPPALRTEVILEPSRVEAGNPAAGQVKATNGSSRRTLPLQIELPVGSGVATFDIPSLAPADMTEELFVIPTQKRGVICVGPAMSVRGDPMGLFQREASNGVGLELMVHPHIVGLGPFGSGLLRDLEGLTTKDLSVSDLAFHALREYAPGDDRRYVHWRSSARAGRLLVRQFQDTRRSTLCIVVDGHPGSYGDEEEFETALEVAASLGARACKDELSTTLVAGDQAAIGSVSYVLLDVLSRAQLHPKATDIGDHVSRAISKGAEISFGVIVSGSAREAKDLQRAASRFPVDVRVIAIRVTPNEQPSVRAGGRAAVAQLRRLSDLPGIMSIEVAA